MLDAQTYGFAIARPLSEVYEFLLEPRNFAKWAFVGDVAMRQLGEREWAVETSVGPRIIRFASRNRLGVLDHDILLDPNDRPHPTGMRVVANEAGTELIYTNFRRASMDPEAWQSLKDWVVTDLQALQSLLETKGRMAPLMRSRTIGFSIRRPFREVYEFLLEPLNFSKWLFVQDADMEPLGDGEWAAETSVGARILRFSGRNAFGVLDFQSRLKPGGAALPIPMRVLPNGDGSELVYTFFQRPGTTEEEWASLIEWVTADLAALQSMLEAGA